MRKIFILLAAVMLALCFAIPAVAGPPGKLPVLEVALSADLPAVSALPVYQEPVIVAVPRLEMSASSQAVVASALVLGVYYIVIMLAGLMRRLVRRTNCEGKAMVYDPRDRLHALARDQTALA